MIEKSKEELLRKAIKHRFVWYMTEPIQYQLVEGLKYKEGMFLKSEGGGTVRNLKINKVEYLKSNLREWGFFRGNFNLYCSLGYFPDMPMASWNRVIYKKQKEDFNEKVLDYMKGYSFMFDFDQEDDEKDINACYESTKRVKEIFDQYNIIYYIVFSGQKGFHIRVDYEDFPQWLKNLDMVKLINTLKVFTERFKMIENIAHIDHRLMDIRRVTKVPYSIVIPKQEYAPIHEFKIAMPLSDEEFDSFKMENYLLSNCLTKASSYKNRGVLKRKGNPENFGKLIKEYLGE